MFIYLGVANVSYFVTSRYRGGNTNTPLAKPIGSIRITNMSLRIRLYGSRRIILLRLFALSSYKINDPSLECWFLGEVIESIILTVLTPKQLSYYNHQFKTTLYIWILLLWSKPYLLTTAIPTLYDSGP